MMLTGDCLKSYSQTLKNLLAYNLSFRRVSEQITSLKISFETFKIKDLSITLSFQLCYFTCMCTCMLFQQVKMNKIQLKYFCLGNPRIFAHHQPYISDHIISADEPVLSSVEALIENVREVYDSLDLLPSTQTCSVTVPLQMDKV